MCRHTQTKANKHKHTPTKTDTQAYVDEALTIKYIILNHNKDNLKIKAKKNAYNKII